MSNFVQLKNTFTVNGWYFDKENTDSLNLLYNTKMLFNQNTTNVLVDFLTTINNPGVDTFLPGEEAALRDVAIPAVISEITEADFLNIQSIIDGEGALLDPNYHPGDNPLLLRKTINMGGYEYQVYEVKGIFGQPTGKINMTITKWSDSDGCYCGDSVTYNSIDHFDTVATKYAILKNHR